MRHNALTKQCNPNTLKMLNEAKRLVVLAIALIGDWKQEIYNKIAMCRGFTILITSAKLATICSMKPS
ncbi:hypothetical protein HID58_014395 [Brassica napus]|uniref:Uncharacterized protein n=1 Tax=Brassica napus TaxID=3708 RepID=A0ABQ8DHK4_BRANA|nr:hypothetical protein HID58_014395 [Brassica napus]